MVANWGVPEAQYRFGLRVQKGDPSAAALWFEVAAEQGHRGAQFRLAEAYDRGRGVEEDDEQALKLYRKAAEQDHPEAQDALARMYLNAAAEAYDDPDEARRLRAEAFRWYEKAALARIAEAQYQLGFLYAQGWGAEKDVVEALAWCWLAGEGGYGGPVHCQFIESRVNAEQSGRANERLGELKDQGLTATPFQQREGGQRQLIGNVHSGFPPNTPCVSQNVIRALQTRAPGFGNQQSRYNTLKGGMPPARSTNRNLPRQPPCHDQKVLFLPAFAPIARRRAGAEACS